MATLQIKQVEFPFIISDCRDLTIGMLEKENILG